MGDKILSRRQALEILGAFAGPCLMSGQAQAQQLPLKTTGLEHVGMIVPDPESTAKFYGPIFNPQLFNSGSSAMPNFVVMTGVGYISVTAARPGAPPGLRQVDHFCALVQDYKPDEMKTALQKERVSIIATGGTGAHFLADPDGLVLQLEAVPGGFVNPLLPYPRISQDYPAVQAIGLDHVMLAVSDLNESAAHYSKLFGKEVARTRKPERVWFGVAKTKLGLQLKAQGTVPTVNHVCFKVAGFDRRIVTERLKKQGVEIAPNKDEDVVRFRDPNGAVVELKG